MKQTTDESTIIDQMVEALEQIPPIDLPPEQEAAILAGQEQIQQKQALDYLSHALPRLIPDGLIGSPLEQRVAIATVKDFEASVRRRERQVVVEELAGRQATQELQTQTVEPATSVPSVADALASFLKSRPEPRERTRGTRDGFYGVYLPRALSVLGLRPTPAQVEEYIHGLADPNRKPKPMAPGGQAACFRSLRAFYNWLYARRSPYNGCFRSEDNPFHKANDLKPPHVPDRILPAQTEQSVLALMSEAGKGENPLRDQAILALLIESGARLEEIVIDEPDIVWEKRQFRTTKKGGDDAYYGFHAVSEGLIKAWLHEYHPNGSGIWGLKKTGIRQMLRRLEERTGIKCNPHSFRRGFARIQRERGVDSLDIMTLGNWASLAMVLRYTKSVDFDNAQRRYQAPLRVRSENPRVPSSILGLGTKLKSGSSLVAEHLLAKEGVAIWNLILRST